MPSEETKLQAVLCRTHARAGLVLGDEHGIAHCVEDDL
jgi:hypothetical protein